jgi:signal transduction histidine kinase
MPSSPPVSRHRSIRTKLISLLALPLVALVALWAYAGVTTFGAALWMLKSKEVNDKLLQPTEALIGALQHERRLSVTFVAGDRTVDRAAFDLPRAQTDRARATYQRMIRDGSLRAAFEPDTAERVDRFSSRLSELDPLRRSIDGGLAGRQLTLDGYTSLIESALSIYASVDGRFLQQARDGRTLTLWGYAQEYMSREDALIAGVLTARQYTLEERVAFTQLVATQRSTLANTESYLTPATHSRYQEFLSSAELSRFRALEDRMMREGGRPTADPQTWQVAAGDASAKLVSLGLAAVTDTTDHATQEAIVVFIQLGLAGGVGLIAIIVSVLVAIRISRRLMREFRGLTNAVNHFSDTRLPEIAELVRRGEPIDPDAGVPVFRFGVTEAEELNRAFATSRRAVVEATENEAKAHRGVSEVFVNLARRNQVLLQRQLKLLDVMERRSDDPTELADLFRLDHMSTRMRRHAEGLVILSGKAAGRTWRSPVPLVDVLRGAAAEVEDYPRVRVLPTQRAALSGAAVADTIHMLAELIENATEFSPPSTPVQVTGHLVPNGFAIEVEDRGLGLSQETLDELNTLLKDPPQFDLTDSARLGLHVVGRLAKRHDINVTLRTSPYGGTLAIVLIPPSLIEDLTDDAGTQPGGEPRAITPHDIAPREILSTQLAPPTSRSLPAGRQPPTTAPGAAPPEPTAPGAASAPAAAAGAGAAGNGGALPRRRRQANLVPQLQQEPPGGEFAEDEDDRPPEVVLSRMSAMQRGWRRGRAEAEQSEVQVGPPTRSNTEEDGR